MKEAFDDLAKALASGMSRREALKRFGIAAAGTLLFFRHPGGAHAGESSDCKTFCEFIYGKGTDAYHACWEDAKHGKGTCFEFGPKSKACRGASCPQYSFCVSNDFNFNYTGSPSSFHCIPIT